MERGKQKGTLEKSQKIILPHLLFRLGHSCSWDTDFIPHPQQILNHLGVGVSSRGVYHVVSHTTPSHRWKRRSREGVK